ncbi:MAG: pyridoxal-5-phosphate-dependent protein subunit beta, partial [Candidatus Hodarchaeales archaeon]
MIDLTINEGVLNRAVQRARERNIIIPTFEEKKHPNKLVSSSIRNELSNLSLWEVHPRNLFRIT